MRPAAAAGLPPPGTVPARRALVIAAGAGLRLRRAGDAVKPLTPVLGVPLIVRTLLTLREAGVASAVVVTGCNADEVEGRLSGDPRVSSLPLQFVRNPEWRKQNGLSVLAASAAIDGEPFVLSMADHVYTPDLVRAVLRAPRATGELLLGVDLRLGAVPDPDEATWVRLGPRHRILDIAKRLRPRDAVDTGVFLADRSLFEALAAERCARAGDCALTDGVRRLAGEGRARGVDVGDAWWSDVDTHEDLLRTERHLQAAVGALADSGD